VFQSFSTETDCNQEEIYSGDCVFSSELESRASVVRQRILLPLIFTVGCAVLTAGVSGARRRSVSLAMLNIVFSSQAALLLGGVLLFWGFG
jgi:hypothetical protein